MNITAGSNLRLHEVEEAASLIMEAAHEDCNIIFGAVVDDKMGDALRITVIATGFDQHEPAEDVLGEAIKAHNSLRRSQRPSSSTQLSVYPQANAPAATQQALPMTNVPPPPPYGRREASQSGSYPAIPQPSASQSNMSGSWTRHEVSGDPQEVPAFLRRRNPDGYTR
jgi:cell division protein FtsZ